MSELAKALNFSGENNSFQGKLTHGSFRVNLNATAF
jgi:hypothetical protein